MTDLLSVDDLACVRYDREIFSGIHFVLPAGGLLVIRGANGSGKSSLLRILATLLEPVGGILRWRQKDIRRCQEEYRGALSYVGHKNGIKDGLTAQENLQMNRQMLAAPAPVSCRSVLRGVGLEDVADTLAGALSAGQQRRLALARLLLTRAPLWLLDEPFSALDDKGTNRASDLISRHCHEGGGVVMALHDGRVPVDVPAQNLCL